MSKEIKSSAMDTLFQGLTRESHEEAPTSPEESAASSTSPRTKKVQKASYEVISTMVDPVIMNKIRAISSIEGISIKDVIGVGLKMVVSRYEEVHGTVRTKKAKKGDIEKVFNI